MKKFSLYLLSIITLTGFIACEGNKVNETVGRLRMMNASYNSGGVNIDIDYKTAYDKYVEYLNYSLFRDLIAGKKHTIKIRQQSSGFSIDTNLVVEENRAYTIFLYDSMNNFKHKVVNEVFDVPKGSFCKIRFLHLSNDAPIVDVKRDGSAAVEFGHYENGMNSEYQTFESGNYFFRVNQAGTLNTIYTQQPRDFKAGYFYTMYLKGNTGSTGTDSLGLFVVENNGDY
ncbi:MAG: DUF4397 domain-containing protein [Chitinophagaceae bacterium]|nr:DUF4397 domain-containing protein [Chitinophagaceae bacterium]